MTQEALEQKKLKLQDALRWLELTEEGRTLREWLRRQAWLDPVSGEPSCSIFEAANFDPYRAAVIDGHRTLIGKLESEIRESHSWKPEFNENDEIEA